MAVPTRTGINIWNTPSQVICQTHSVPVTIWTDYAIWCDSHGSYIPWEATTNFTSATDE